MAKKERFSYLINTLPENLSKMAGFLGYRANEHIVVLDTNMVDCPVEKELAAASVKHIDEISRYNANLSKIIRDYAVDRVIITKDVRAEMLVGLSAAESRIKGTPKGNLKHQQSLSQLLDSYHKIQAQVSHKKRAEYDYDSGGEIYNAFLDITRKIVRDIPDVKKDARVGDNETDEKLVAYAFAQAFNQDKKAIIFSIDRDLTNIAKNLYGILTCNNTLGNSKIGKKIKMCNIEVMTYDNDTKKFAPAFTGNNVNGYWKPDAYGVDVDSLVSYAAQKLMPFEAKNGNGHAKKAIEDAEKEELQRRDTAPLPVVKQLDDFQRQRFIAACERIYRKLRVNPDDLKLADMDTVEDTIQTYKDMILLYEDRGLPMDSLREELKQIEEHSVAGKISKLEKECEDIAAKVHAITQNSMYFKDKAKRDEVNTLQRQLESNASEMESLEKRINDAKQMVSFDGFNEAEQKLYKDFVKEGYTITEEGTPIGIEALMKVTGRNRTGIYGLFNILGKKKDILVERIKGKKPEKGKPPVLYIIKPNLIPHLLKKK